MKSKNIEWDKVDWNLNNGEIARLLGLHTTTVFEARKKRNISPATTPGRCSPENRFKESYKYSPVTKPIRDLDYEFSVSIRKDGRKKANKSFRQAAIDMLGPICKICGYYKESISNHVHHIIPLSEGGKNNIRNAIILCSRCHNEVHANVITILNST